MQPSTVGSFSCEDLLRNYELPLELRFVQRDVALHKRVDVCSLGNGDVLAVHQQEQGRRRPITSDVATIAPTIAPV